MKLSRIKTFSDEQYNVFIRTYIFPLIAIVVFLGFWSMSAQQVQTSLGQLPGPTAVFHQASNLVDEHKAEREKEVSFYERQEIKDAIAYLQITANPANDLKFERIINVPKRGLGDVAQQKIQVAARTNGVSLVEGARLLLASKGLGGKGANMSLAAAAAGWPSPAACCGWSPAWW